MRYRSTRDIEAKEYVTAAEAIKRGLAPDGGLYLPEGTPELTAADIEKLCGMTYSERAAYVLSLFLDDYDKDGLKADCDAAYGEEKFPSDPSCAALGGSVSGAAPVVDIGGGIYSLELWHGPTCAFKDMALQIMPRLLVRALRMTGEEKLAHILVATSGDTGKAALEGYRDVDGVKMTVFYPNDGVSKMQQRQMTTQEGNNVYVCAVEGNFDDAQTGVKKIFSDKALAEKALANGFFFSSANSINWGRLVPQVVYYISAYCDLVSAGKIKMGDLVNVCVPTGNFGNIFAAYIAREMGLPVGHFICASNANNVLTDFINTGVYDRTREFYKTMSPSMDILISSNLERLLCRIGGEAMTKELMTALNTEGKYTAPADVMEKIRALFSGYCMNEEETASALRRTFEERGYLADPHTTVGLGCAEKYRAETGDETPIILASTASPYKFSADVCRSLGMTVADENDIEGILNALSAATKTEIPAPLARTLTLPVRFTEVVDPAKMAEIPFRG